MQGVYLDHAATSFPKPDVVLAAVERWFRELGVSAQRGDGAARGEVADAVAGVRRKLAARCGVPTERVAFCSGATEAIHLFLDGFLRPGQRVLTTDLEHSAIARPLTARAARGDIEVERVAADPTRGTIDARDVESAMRAGRFDLFAFTTASNVTGVVVDAAAFVRAAREHGCVTLCDASQTAGLLPLDVGADAVVTSAHKSLLGPPGLGLLAVRPDLALTATKLGGTGATRASAEHPTDWPTAFEAGTPNTPAILGLGAALDWIDARGERALLEHGLACCDAFRAAAASRVHFIAPPPTDAARVPVLSFVHDVFEPVELGALLGEHGIVVRSGFHCAPWIHDAIGTGVGGTVRVSPGPFVSADEMDRAASVLPRAPS